MVDDAMRFAGLKVAIVGPLPPPAGGMANQTRQLAELLQAGQARVQMVPSNAPYWPAWVSHLPGLRAAFRLVPYAAALWRAAGSSSLLHVMANSGWSWHLFAAPAIWIARLRRVPVVVNYRGGEAAAFLARSGTSVRRSMRCVSRLIVPSAFLQQIFQKHGMAAEIVPNIVDLGRFHPPGDVHRAHGAEPRILVARNLEPIYDNETALRAFALVRARWPQARLTIAGTGPELAHLRALAQTLGIAAGVGFVGRMDRDAMARLYRDSDISLNPSRVDNTPNSVLESLASGVPVVSTSVGGVPFIVRDGVTALLVPPGEPKAMADAVLRLLQDATLYSQLREAGLSEVKRYTWERVAPVLAAVYRGVMLTQPRSPERRTH